MPTSWSAPRRRADPIALVAAAPLDRALFALDPSLAYLNHAAVGVLPVATRDAVHRFVDAHAARGVLGVAATELDLPQLRARIGALIGVAGADIALLRNTGDGATVLAQGLRVAPGDEIVVGRNEFGSNAYPWMALRERGAVIRFVDAPRERLTPAVLAAAITPRTRAVAVSWVTFDDGYRHDLEGLARVAHAAGALLFVDAIQGLGVFPLDAPALGIDALYAGGAKWLMALQGISFLYVRPELRERLAVALPGWRSVADIWNFLAYDQPWIGEASRFEGGTPNLIGALSLASSVDVLRAAGIERIAEHVLALTDRLEAALRAKGCTLRGERSGSARSGIVTFVPPDGDAVALGKRLARAGFVTTNRPGGVRVSPHGYNTVAEIDALVAAV